MSKSKITFEVDGKEYEIPDYITIEDYVKVFKVKDLFVDEYFAAKVLSILTGAKVDDLLTVNYQVLEKLAGLALSKFPKDKRFYQKFEFNGKEYGFLPDWRKMSYGEFIDLDTLMSRKDNELLDSVHLMTAIMYRPIIKTKRNGAYEIEEYDMDKMEERAEEFKKLDAKYFISGQFFFINFVRTYRGRSLLYLAMEKMTMKQRMKMLWKISILKGRLGKDGDITTLLTSSQNMILQK